MVTLCEITAGAAEASIWGVVGHVLLLFLFSFIAAMVVMTFAGLSVVAERKVCAFIQGRLGPNRTAIPIVAAIPLLGNFLKRNGLMQLLADALKFLFKEDPIPGHVNKFWYMAAPAMFLAPVLIVGAVIPFGVYWSDGSMHPIAVADFDLSVIFMLAISSLTVFGGLMAGWSSNSKLPYIAATRSGAALWHRPKTPTFRCRAALCRSLRRRMRKARPSGWKMPPRTRRYIRWNGRFPFARRALLRAHSRDAFQRLCPGRTAGKFPPFYCAGIRSASARTAAKSGSGRESA